MYQKTNSKVYINKKKIENCNKKSMFIADDSGDVFYMTGKDMNASVYRLTGKEKDELLLDGVQENCCISGAGFFYNKIGGRIKSLCFKDKNAEEKVVDTNVDAVVRTMQTVVLMRFLLCRFAEVFCAMRKNGLRAKFNLYLKEKGKICQTNFVQIVERR